MLFDSTLANIARTLPQSRVFATHAMPGRQPERAVDGVGGYFHTGRPENQCYISEKKPYEFWQIDVRTDTGQPREIVALRYVPPSSNRSRNKGLRFQLIQATAPPIPVGDSQTKYYEVRWPAVPTSTHATEDYVLQFKSIANPTIIYLEFKTTFKENNALVQDANIVRISGTGFTAQTAAASAFGITRDGGANFYFSISPNSIKIKNGLTGYEYPTTITPTNPIPIDDIQYVFWPTAYIRQVDAGAVSQYVVSEFVLRSDVYDQTIDFRMPTLTPRPITEVLSPRIISPSAATLYQLLATALPSTPTGIAEDSAGNLYVSSGQYIYKYTLTNSYAQPFILVNRGAGVIINTLTIDSTDRLWFTTSQASAALCSTPSVLTATALVTATAFSTINFTNLNGICVTNTTIYVSRDQAAGTLHSINRTTAAVIQVGPTMGSPRGITIRSEFSKDILYICCADDFKVRRFDIAANFTELPSIGIGISDTNTQNVSEKMYTYFQSPYGIFNDTTTNTLYITDSLGNKVYYVPPDRASGIDAKVYTLAGTGSPGNVNPSNGPALDALLNQPTNGIVSRKTGNYIFIDYNNSTLRIILLDQTAAITTFTDRILPQTLWSTTTIPGADIDPLPSIPILPQALNRTRDTIKELANTGRLQTSL
jgi:sugar lactone lactonase YvrE